MLYRVRAALVRARELFRRRSRYDREQDEEFRFHIQMETAENVRRGMSEPEARRAALVRFGGQQRYREETSDARGIIALERWGQHLRLAFRAMRRHPGFSVAAVLTLALGIGLNTALFTVFYSLGFRPFDVHDGDRLVNVYHVPEGRSRYVHGFAEMISWDDFESHARAIRSEDGPIEAAAVYASAGLTLTANGAVAARGQYVSCGYFATIGVQMSLGRGFAEDECARPGESAVAVLSHLTWNRHFGGDSAAIGRTVRINQTTFSVIGVAQPGFAGLMLEPADVWIPVTMQPTVGRGQQPDSMFAGDWSWLVMVARLSPGAGTDDARAKLAVTAGQQDRVFPGRATRVVVTRGGLLNFPQARSGAAIVATILGVLGALVVVMICANLMNLLLARGLARRREVGIRLAVGASRRRLVEQMLVESGLLALIGGALGFALAFLLPALVPRLVPIQVQVDLSPDGRVLAFTAIVSLATAIFFGLVPAWRATRVDLVSAFKGGGERAGAHPSRLRNVIVGVQVAGSALLLIVAALLVRAARHGSSIDLGYTTDGVATFELNLPMLGYPPERARATYEALVQRLQATPGVQAVSLASPLPLLGNRSDMLRDADAAGDDAINVSFVSATASHFATLEIPIVAGRAFTDADVAAAGIAGDQPLVISQALASRLGGDSSPLGKRLAMGDASYRVVGVAVDARMTSLGGGLPFMYVPAHPGRDQNLHVLVRATGSLAPIERLVPQLAAAMDPSIVVKTQRLGDRLALELMPARLSSAVAGTMGALTLLLALVGIYGVVSYAVAQRARDIAVRRALGANDAVVVRLMMRQGLRSVVIGLAAGAAIAVVASRALRGVLLGVSPLDALSFASAILVLLMTAGMATWVPARRASRVDPARILRED